MLDIDLQEYNYDLPDELIAQYPLKERDSSRLLVFSGGTIKESLFSRIPDFLPEGSLLVFNNTKVIRARLLFRKETGAIIEILLLEPSSPSDYELSLGSKNQAEWRCLVGNLRRWKEKSISTEINSGNLRIRLTAELLSSGGENHLIRFRWDNSTLTFGEIIERSGHIPLPPYIRRSDEADDAGRYQTVYSTVEGSVAAPTAGLHFTEKTFSDLKNRKIRTANLTLHVGAGTFLPLKTTDIKMHDMHTEHFTVDFGTIKAVSENPGKVIAVGTTSVRTLESLYWIGIKLNEGRFDFRDRLSLDQWEAYSGDSSLTPKQSLDIILDRMSSSGIKSINVATRIIIVPGYKFRITDGMVTNFHLPKSTLLLLVSAFAGSKWKEIYNYAIKHGFRFLSYGDSSLLLK